MVKKFTLFIIALIMACGFAVYADEFDNNDVYVFSEGFKNGGAYGSNYVYDLAGETSISFFAEINNNTGTAAKVRIVVARYEGNALSEIVVNNDYNLDTGYNEIYTNMFNVSGYSEDAYIKAFIFRDMENIQPLSYCRIINGVPKGKDAWLTEPVNALSETKEQIVLSGEWEYMPADGNYKFNTNGSKDSDWGTIMVPGSWRYSYHNHMDNYSAGNGSHWNNYKSTGYDQYGLNTAVCWYRRDIKIPESWNGKQIKLEFERIATVAIIYIDDVKCGNVVFPGGELDITDYVKPGQVHELKAVVAATGKKGSYETEQEFIDNWNQGRIVTNLLDSAYRGIIDDVMLNAYNESDLLTGVFIQTGVKSETLRLDLEFEQISKKQDADITVNIIDYKTKKIVDTLRTKVSNIPEGSSTKKIMFSYITPKLWDYKQPNLYLCDIHVKGETIDDNLVERFGFREFTMDGKDFYLNGSLIRLRTYGYDSNFSDGVYELERERLRSFVDIGANILEIWPNNRHSRSTLDFYDQVADLADEIGIMLMMPTAQIDEVTGWMGNLEGDKYQRWYNTLVPIWKKTRNNPSVVINIGSGNRFSNNDHLNPRRIGNSKTLDTPANDYRSQLAVANQVFSAIENLDPTRPTLAHNGANASDIHSTNIYLGFIPLQEREEWLSAWSVEGDKPFSAVEYGTPLSFSFGGSRNQNDGLGGRSQALATEFATIYIGNDAYLSEMDTEEGATYRNAIKNTYASEREYSLCSQEMSQMDSFRKVQSLFSTNTYRSWRTYGISGGMLPWDRGYFWDNSNIPGDWHTPVGITRPEPGEKGVFSVNLTKRALTPSNSNMFLTSVGKDVLPNIQETLAYVGGYPNFVSKEHHYYSGELLTKQIVLINDSREVQRYNVTVMDGNGGSRQLSGSLGIGEIKFERVDFNLPYISQKTDKVIELTATIGANLSTDSFEYTIYPKTAAVSKSVYIYDSIGDTKRMLQEKGYKFITYINQSLSANDILIIGRKSLGSFDYEAVAESGAKIIIFEQDKETAESRFGFRVHEVVSRRFWPIENINSPILEGLDGEDFRDWNGSASMVPNERYTDIDERNQASLVDPYATPTYGWHWGNTGGISGYVIDKPDNSNWKPLIEGEFDMNYTAFLQRDNVIYCGLDLEARGMDEPVADILLNRLISANWGSLKQQTPTYFIGSNASVLGGIGLEYQPAYSMPESGLVILGENHGVSDDKIKAFVDNGNKVVSLGQTVLGFSKGNTTYNGFVGELAYPEFAGITISDTRTRTPIDNFAVFTGNNRGEILSNGFIGRYSSGGGVAVLFSLIPSQVNTGSLPYLRYTQWHIQAAISRVLSNLGAEFTDSSMYYPGYSTDYDRGDDPFRWHNW